MAAVPESMRVDKWLWASRFFKTRSLAQEAVELGRVRISGQRIKPSREVRPGDEMEIERAGECWEITVKGLSAVRGPAPAARLLYEESTESRERRERLAEQRKYTAEPALARRGGRPTKRDGRLIRSLGGF